MKKKLYDKPTMKVVQLKQRSHILAGSPYSVTTGLGAMDDDVDLGDAAQTQGTGLWGMGADEDLE